MDNKLSRACGVERWRVDDSLKLNEQGLGERASERACVCALTVDATERMRMRKPTVAKPVELAASRRAHLSNDTCIVHMRRGDLGATAYRKTEGASSWRRILIMPEGARERARGGRGVPRKLFFILGTARAIVGVDVRVSNLSDARPGE